MREKQQVNMSQTEPERAKPAETGQKRKQEAERSERVRVRMKRGSILSNRSLEMSEKNPHSAASPDGGWGWMIVAGCFLTTVCTRAVTRSVHDSPKSRFLYALLTLPGIKVIPSHHLCFVSLKRPYYGKDFVFGVC